MGDRGRARTVVLDARRARTPGSASPGDAVTTNTYDTDDAADAADRTARELSAAEREALAGLAGFPLLDAIFGPAIAPVPDGRRDPGRSSRLPGPNTSTFPSPSSRHS